jgi:hypothetical protein
MLACIIHAFALHQISIGELLHISSQTRKVLFTTDMVWSTLEPVINGENDEAFLVYESWREDKDWSNVVWEGRHQPTHPASDTASLVTVRSGGEFDFYQSLKRPEGFVAVINLRTYLARMDE